MTNREKILATTLLVLLVVLGGGVLFHLFVYEPITQVRTQLSAAREGLLTRQNELAQEERTIEGILRVNPRLAQWQKISLPPRDPDAKKLGVSPEEQKRKHLARMQVEYERYLSERMLDAGFSRDSIVITPRQPDRRSAAPALKTKEPLYERLAFAASGRGNLASVVQVLRELHKAPLLHQVRSLSVATAPERSGRSRNAAGTLDLSMTVEALLVNGAEDRSALLPSQLAYPPKVLAEASRDYAVMDRRNMFVGIAPPPPPAAPTRVETEERSEVLRFVKLTSLWYDDDRKRWEGTLYDQAKGGPEKKINTVTRDEFVIYDKDENSILEGRVVLIDEEQVIFKSEGKFYRLRIGDFLYPAVRQPLSSAEVKSLELPKEDD